MNVIMTLLKMGNGANFFARDNAGRRSEYISIVPAVTINGVKGHLIKKVGILTPTQIFHTIPTPRMFISGRMGTELVRLVFILAKNYFLILTGATTIQIKMMAGSFQREWYMCRFGNRTMTGHSLV